MLAVLLAVVSGLAPTYIPISAKDFLSLVWGLNQTANFSPDDYINQPAASYIVREAGEPTTGYNETFYRVSGTPAEVAQLSSFVTPIYDTDTNISDLTPPYAFVVLVKEPSFNQMSTFWVTVIVVIVGLVFFIGSLLIWGTDEYAKDPVNSLLFVTDGNRIVTGE
jgi:hypothetical protein